MSNDLRRKELGIILKEIVGNNNVYFQSPSNIRMQYPCCKYDISGSVEKRANNNVYGYTKRYTVTFISNDVDNDYYEKMMTAITMCRFDRRYIADNLCHDVFMVYY